jgi:hypothetical protein
MAFCRIDKVGIGSVQRTFDHGHSIAWSVFVVCPLYGLQAALRPGPLGSLLDFALHIFIGRFFTVRIERDKWSFRACGYHSSRRINTGSLFCPMVTLPHLPIRTSDGVDYLALSRLRAGGAMRAIQRFEKKWASSFFVSNNSDACPVCCLNHR